jgi:toxin ParE1/3/4
VGRARAEARGNLAAIDEAEASLARGEGRIITRESMRELAEQVHQRGLARLLQGPLMVYRLSLEAEAELDEIWWYIAEQSGSVEAARSVVASITERVSLLATFPHLGRTRDDLRPGLRGFTVGDYVILYRIEGDDDPAPYSWSTRHRSAVPRLASARLLQRCRNLR